MKNYDAHTSDNPMLTLIAESKTMQEGKESPADCINSRIPGGETVAAEVMKNILSLSPAEIAAELKVSLAMASKIIRMAYDFPVKETSCDAVEAFTGVVFKALDFPSLSPSAKEYIDRNVRIISSLYGWLTPRDRVKPYRLEYSSRLAPSDMALSRYWRKDISIQLVKTLQERNIHDVINLLPGDAEKCIDKKLVKGFAHIWKVEFKQIIDGGSLRTPPSGRLKELRGRLLREMAEKNITSPDQLKILTSTTFLPLGTPQFADHIVFAVE